jgi:hypothetical protein
MSLFLLLNNQTPPVPLQGNTFFWLKESGTWRLCSVYLKESGAYGYAKPYINVLGNWK